MPFRIIRDDLTHVRADAIVNTANPEPVIGSGTDSAVYRAAGEEALLADRKKIGAIHPGEVAVTGAHALNARYILHTVGPDWRKSAGDAARLLASCYRKSLLLAQQLGCESIAFPLISSGNYGYPREEALQIALDNIRSFLQDAEMDVTLVVYDRNSYALSAALTDHVDAYIDEKYIEKKKERRARNSFFFRRREREADEMMSAPALGAGHFAEVTGAPSPDAGLFAEETSDLSTGTELFSEAITEDSPVFDAETEVFHGNLPASAPAARPAALRPSRPEETVPAPSAARPSVPKTGAQKVGAPKIGVPKPGVPKPRRLKDLIGRKSETFQEQLLRLIDEKGYTDVEVYKRANVDRKLFSKIRSNADYHPKKSTAVALAMALKLNKDEMTDLLRLAGIAMSPASIADLIIGYCVENGIYDLFEVNALLFDYDQPLLGGGT